MAVDNVKSTSMTNLTAANPTIANTAGKGAASRLQHVNDYVTAVASSSADSVYRVLRLPSNAIVKDLFFESEAQGAGKFDVGVYRSDLASYVAANATDQDFFATVIDCASAVARTSIINESGTNTVDKRNKPLWEAIGLTEDPKVPLDICLTVKTTAVTTGTGKVSLEAVYVEY